MSGGPTDRASSHLIHCQADCCSHCNATEKIDLNEPRHEQHNLALRKGLKFYQTRSNAIILNETLPAYCIPKVVRTENEEVIYEKSIHVTSASTKDLLEARPEKRIGPRTRSTTRRTSCATIFKFPIEPTKSKPKS